MVRSYSSWCSCIFLLSSLGILSGSSNVTREERKVYIVYMGSLPKENYSPTKHHISILQEVLNSSESNPKEHLIRSYKRSFNGFAANLTCEEQQKMATHNDVVWIIPSTTLKLQTTASWDFMGFPQNVHRNLSLEGDIIIGVIDTGIWPESKSFDDYGFGAIPKKWKGGCYAGRKNFTCNNKLIGARYYGSIDSPRDFNGHGSHTASIAAGNIVQNVSFYGIAQGIARGGVPSARIAVYNVCDHDAECKSEDMFASFDDAIADGVDIITISLGPIKPTELENDAVAIGSFHAAEKGILTTQAAGNYGTVGSGYVISTAPWLFSVGASTINRKIINKIALENGVILEGHAVNTFNSNGTKFPLVYGKTASHDCDEGRARSCEFGCLDPKLVKGKILVCDYDSGVLFAPKVEALGSINLVEAEDYSEVVPSLASFLGSEQFKQLESYINSTKMPQGNILKSESIQDLTAPVVASFSSRGPNSVFPDILKPDIVAPGVDIIAAFSPEGSPSDAKDIDKRHVDYSILSGTSMSCPHVAGAAAYVKSLNPKWSPSAIKSAIMTTAWQMNSTNSVWGDAEFSYGAGHVDPIKAANPGLVYETLKEDYMKFFCGLNYDSSAIRKIFGDKATCSGLLPSKPEDMNYPTMAAKVGKGKPFSVEFQRTVTNVGFSYSTYKAKITKTSQCNIKVEPSSLIFNALNERQSFNVTINGDGIETMVSASLEWFDGVHNVRSPIVLYTTNETTVESLMY